MSKARLVITTITVEKRQVSEVAKSYGSPAPGFTRCCPATGPRARQRSSRGHAERLPRPRSAPAPSSSSSGCARSWPARGGCWAADHRLAPGAAPPAEGLPGDRAQPLPVSQRPGHSRPVQAPEVVLHPVRRPRCPTSAAVRLHPHDPLAGGTDTEILTWLDDHSRYALSPDRAPTGSPALPSCWPSAPPASSTAFRPQPSPTTAWSSPPACPAARAAATPWSTSCAASGIKQKNGKPNHPP